MKLGSKTNYYVLAVQDDFFFKVLEEYQSLKDDSVLSRPPQIKCILVLDFPLQ